MPRRRQGGQTDRQTQSLRIEIRIPKFKHCLGKYLASTGTQYMRLQLVTTLLDLASRP